MSDLHKMSDKRPKAKPRGKPFTGADDPRRAKGGRPKDERSITYWLKEFGQLTPVELANRCKIYAMQLRKGGDDLPVFAIVAVRQLIGLMDDTDARLLSVVQDRTEGKVVQPIEWRQKVKDAGLDPDAVVQQVESWLAETSETSEPESG